MSKFSCPRNSTNSLTALKNYSYSKIRIHEKNFSELELKDDDTIKISVLMFCLMKILSNKNSIEDALDYVYNCLIVKKLFVFKHIITNFSEYSDLQKCIVMKATLVLINYVIFKKPLPGENYEEYLKYIDLFANNNISKDILQFESIYILLLYIYIIYIILYIYFIILIIFKYCRFKFEC
jgi:hypothetical protein